mmetsp:Transcript_13437/g.29134  ORF Transcript_13437/g.29134 Transcript_13437/m.29134 type:complete len:209 (-) Transcript_13437:34-660(-)
MTFERKVVLPTLLLHVVYRNATFNRTHREACLIWEAGHNTGLVFQQRYFLIVRRSRFADVIHEQLAICSGYNKKRTNSVHGIHALWHWNNTHGRTRWSTYVPVSYALIPRARDDAGRAVPHVGHVYNSLDGRIVLRNNLSLVRCRRPHFRGLITTGRKYGLPIRGPRHAQNGSVVLDHSHRNSLPRLLHFPASHLVVPRPGDEKVLRT